VSHLIAGVCVHSGTPALEPCWSALKSGDDEADAAVMMEMASRLSATTEVGLKNPGVSSMHMLYNSDSYAVVQIELAADENGPARHNVALTRGGYEIVDKFARKEIFIEGALAETFKEGVEALIESSPSVEEFDAYLERYAGMAQQPVVMH
jgi:hypothetical protein